MRKITLFSLLLVLVAFAVPCSAGEKDVNVANEPTVHVGSMPDVHLGDTADVNVTNTDPIPVSGEFTLETSETDPALVRDVDNSARDPYQGSFAEWIEEGQNCVSGNIQVPPNKRLVIRYVSAEATVPDGQKAHFSIGTRVKGLAEVHRTVPTNLGIYPTGLGPKVFFVTAQPMYVFADPNTEVMLGVCKDSFEGTGSFKMVISGYYVNVE